MRSEIQQMASSSDAIQEVSWCTYSGRYRKYFQRKTSRCN